ncbi:MAG: hypothetical protein EXQ70_07090 [Solirubrobacterales bacterium]|nr:hypothetical protein [Solirubrobacterales bacterium]
MRRVIAAINGRDVEAYLELCTREASTPPRPWSTSTSSRKGRLRRVSGYLNTDEGLRVAGVEE